MQRATVWSKPTVALFALHTFLFQVVSRILRQLVWSLNRKDLQLVIQKIRVHEVQLKRDICSSPKCGRLPEKERETTVNFKSDMANSLPTASSPPSSPPKSGQTRQPILMQSIMIRQHRQLKYDFQDLPWRKRYITFSILRTIQLKAKNGNPF